MSRRIQFAVDEYYHIYNRGADKRTIFESPQDYRRFLVLLYLCNGEEPVDIWLTKELKGETFQLKDVDRGVPLIAIGAYCLMLNHFHLLVREATPGGVTRFMRKLGTAYTMYFNATRQRTGALFQGAFKAKHADSDTYLKYLFAYIHLNPPNPTSYQCSSYTDYSGQARDLGSILSISSFPEYFPTPASFQACIHDWIAIRSQLEASEMDL